MYYYILVLDSGEIEVLETENKDVDLINLFEKCIGNKTINNIQVQGNIVDWNFIGRELIMHKPSDLLDIFNYLQDGTEADTAEYEELKDYILKKYIKENISYEDS